MITTKRQLRYAITKAELYASVLQLPESVITQKNRREIADLLTELALVGRKVLPRAVPKGTP